MKRSGTGQEYLLDREEGCPRAVELLGGLKAEEMRINQGQLHPNCVPSLSRPLPSAGTGSCCVQRTGNWGSK